MNVHYYIIATPNSVVFSSHYREMNNYGTFFIEHVLIIRN